MRVMQPAAFPLNLHNSGIIIHSGRVRASAAEDVASGLFPASARVEPGSLKMKRFEALR